VSVVVQVIGTECKFVKKFVRIHKFLWNFNYVFLEIHKNLCFPVVNVECNLCLRSGVASMEKMEQLLPRNAKGHFCNSRRSEEIWGGGIISSYFFIVKSSASGGFAPGPPGFAPPGKIFWLRHCVHVFAVHSCAKNYRKLVAVLSASAWNASNCYRHYCEQS